MVLNCRYLLEKAIRVNMSPNSGRLRGRQASLDSDAVTNTYQT